jgi:NOL1/NOP2/fmu family ribosome biogenesis protein
MKLYTLNNKGNRVRISLAEALTKALKSGGFELDNVEDIAEDWLVVGVVQENKSSEQVTVNIFFDGSGNSITNVKVYTDPIRRVVVEDETKVIV